MRPALVTAGILAGSGLAIVLATVLRPRVMASHVQPALGGRSPQEPTVPRLASREPEPRTLPIEAPSGAGSPKARRIRVLRSETGEPLPGAVWRIDGSSCVTIARGTTDDQGLSDLDGEAVAAWRSHPVKVWAHDRRDEYVPFPPDLERDVVDVPLARLRVDHEGVVVGEDGRPIEGAGVLVWRWSCVDSVYDRPDALARAVTDEEGRFRVAGKVWYPATAEEPDDGVMEVHTVWAGAPGSIPGEKRVHRRGESGLRLRLERDWSFGVVELSATEADGAPATGARVRLAEGRSAIGGDALCWYSQIWRAPDDPRPSFDKTWEEVDGERVGLHVLGKDGKRVIHPVEPGRRRLVVEGVGRAETEVDVLPPPAVTRVTLRLETRD